MLGGTRKRWPHLTTSVALALLTTTGVAGAPSTADAANTRQVYKIVAGYDTCQNPGSTGLQAFWNGTPFYFVGLYLGGDDGAAVGCTDHALNTTAWNIGYGIEEFWYGPQMPTSCGGPGGLPDYINTDVNAATTQGIQAAVNAAAAGGTHHLDAGAIIYYDLEGFSNQSSTCLNIAKAFINGWDYGFYAGSSYVPGLYGSTCASDVSVFASIGNVPYAIAPRDETRSPNGVYGLLCLADNLWSFDQRIHQSSGPYHNTYNGFPMYYDNDCADGLVDTPQLAKNQATNCAKYGSPASEPVKPGETRRGHALCATSSRGSLIHAMVGSFGGRGRLVNRVGFAA